MMGRILRNVGDFDRFGGKDRKGPFVPVKVAVVHEWLVTWAGAERVLAEIMGLFPQADLFVLFDRLSPGQRGNLPRDPVGETFLTRIPRVGRIYRNLLPLMPLAIESLNLRDYDLVLSSSHAVAKGLLPHPGQLHLCYCHTPPRYLWDMTEAYFSRSFSGSLRKAAASLFLTPLRQWDFVAGQRPDAFIANSAFVARRIAKIYRRSSTVIPPPVDVDRFVPKTQPGGDYFVTLGRLVPYKNIETIVSAFAGLPERLRVVGDGPGRKNLERLLRGHENIEWFPWITDEEWGRMLLKARAFVFMAEEDFGIAPVEAQAAGVPVIAWGRGGVLETVKGEWSQPSGRSEIDPEMGEASGLFYEAPTVPSLRQALRDFCDREESFLPEVSRRNAGRFSTPVFRDRFRDFVGEEWQRHRKETASFRGMPEPRP